MNNDNQKPIIKNLAELDIDQYLLKLHDWLIENQETYFKDPDYQASSWCDFECWPTKKVSRRELVMPNEVMLIDREDKQGNHCYAITSITKNRKAKDHYFVIKISKLRYGAWRNGYFLLPDLSSFNTTPELLSNNNLKDGN